MKRMSFVKSDTASCSTEFADLLDNAFPALTITPGMSKDEIMYNAGQRDAVAFAMKHVRNSAQDNQVNRRIDV